MDIKKKEIITVQKCGLNTYGDLEFSNTQGNSYKIGKSRVDKFPAIQEGAEVELIWVANPHKPNQDYIYSATQTGKHSALVEAVKKEGGVPVNENPLPSKPVQPTLNAPESKSNPVKPQSSITTPSEVMTPEKWDAKEARTRKSIERQKALELSIIQHTKMGASIESVIDTAKHFEKYFETGV